MKTIFLIPVVSIHILFAIGSLQAQEAISATGGDASGNGGTVSYTVGQVAFLNITESTGYVLQGVQQPYEIYLVTGIEKANGVSLDCIIYPNPVQEHLQLKIQGLSWEKLHWGIYDSGGKLLKSENISNSLSTIPVADLAQGIYLFLVSDKQKGVIKTFQIIKN